MAFNYDMLEILEYLKPFILIMSAANYVKLKSCMSNSEYQQINALFKALGTPRKNMYIKQTI